MTHFVLHFSHSGYLYGPLKDLIQKWQDDEAVTIEKSGYGTYRVYFQTENEGMEAYGAVQAESNILGMALIKEEVLIKQ